MTLMAKRFSLVTFLMITAGTVVWQISHLLTADIAASHIIMSTPAASLTAQTTHATPNPHEHLYLDMVERYRFAQLQHRLLQEQLAIVNIKQQIQQIKKQSNIKTSDYDDLDRAEVVQTQPTPPIPTQPSPYPLTTSQDENVLLAMPSSSYTIKLMSANDRHTLEAFAKQHHIQNQTLCYASLQDGQRIYTLLYGDYLTETAAQSALGTLTDAIQLQEIRIEKLADIQKALKSH